jgi:hypothetical protein
VTHAWKAGDRARVVDLNGLSKRQKPKGWANGTTTRVRSVNADGSRLTFHEHLGSFEARRFEPVK